MLVGMAVSWYVDLPLFWFVPIGCGILLDVRASAIGCIVGAMFGVAIANYGVSLEGRDIVGMLLFAGMVGVLCAGAGKVRAWLLR